MTKGFEVTNISKRVYEDRKQSVESNLLDAGGTCIHNPIIHELTQEIVMC